VTLRIPDIDAFEERASIIEHEGRVVRSVAENLAAQAQGFPDAEQYWQWLADYVISRKVP